MGTHTGDSEESWPRGGDEDMLRKGEGLDQGETEREELTTKDKRGSLSHSLKPFPVTYRPECKSW